MATSGGIHNNTTAIHNTHNSGTLVQNTHSTFAPLIVPMIQSKFSIRYSRHADTTTTPTSSVKSSNNIAASSNVTQAAAAAAANYPLTNNLPFKL